MQKKGANSFFPEDRVTQATIRMAIKPAAPSVLKATDVQLQRLVRSGAIWVTIRKLHQLIARLVKLALLVLNQKVRKDSGLENQAIFQKEQVTDGASFCPHKFQDQTKRKKILICAR